MKLNHFSLMLVRGFIPLITALGLVLSAFSVGAETGDLSSGWNAPASSTVDISMMSTEEKIGQLFLVTFQGSDFANDARIRDLIMNRHVGGVLLETQNNNFSGPENILASTYALTSGLQQLAWDASQNSETSANYLPLFIAVAQNGDRASLDQLISGMTPLPNQLALGATWNPELAYDTGQTLGKELNSLGFNMFLGPSLDVLDDVQQGGGADIGAQVFGGDPYWVGLLGQSYISGLHDGSRNRLAVISKNFPGRGGSDRPSEEEVATVRKSLEQLKQIELAPFFAVTGQAETPTGITDGLLVSHIRYQGFQGNIRATTKPVSFDPEALETILSLDPLKDWRAGGGIIISDRLGSQSLRKFFDPANSGFDARQVARNAFLAGNDILLLDQSFISTGDADAFQTINRTLDFFIQKYNEDPAFARRVDDSVIRIIAMKERLYPDFSIGKVIPPETGIEEIGLSDQTSFDTAREGSTLISPDAAEVKNIIPVPPVLSDRIVFFTDTMTARQCSQCPDEVQMGVDSFQSAILRLYGPHASGQVMQSHLASFSLNRLATFMKDPAGDPELKLSLETADWVIFSLLDVEMNDPESSALFTLLNDFPELIRNKKTVVFAFNAPYYLDATDISKLSAYYALYSKVNPFIDIAARILFQEVQPNGASPVSIPGVGYDIIAATSPDPNQVIPLSVDMNAFSPETPVGAGTEIPPVFKIGDSLPMTTGMIVDQNGNMVPDGTIARFIITTGTDTATTQQIDTVTTGGIATASYQISEPGNVEIRVVSEPAMVSSVLRLEIKEGETSQVTAIAPTPVTTSTPVQSPTDQGDGSGTAGEGKSATGTMKFANWLLSVALIGMACYGIYILGKRQYSSRWGIRWASCAGIGGLIFYILAMIGWRDELLSHPNSQLIALGIVSLVGVACGWLVGYIWLMLPRWTSKRE